MLWFLSIAAKRGFVVDAYADDATGTMARVAKGRLGITEVVLRPRVRFHGAAPDAATHEAMHHEAHDGLLHRQLGEVRRAGRAHARVTASLPVRPRRRRAACAC